MPCLCPFFLFFKKIDIKKQSQPHSYFTLLSFSKRLPWRYDKIGQTHQYWFPISSYSCGKIKWIWTNTSRLKISNRWFHPRSFKTNGTWHLGCICFVPFPYFLKKKLAFISRKIMKFCEYWPPAFKFYRTHESLLVFHQQGRLIFMHRQFWKWNVHSTNAEQATYTFHVLWAVLLYKATTLEIEFKVQLSNILTYIISPYRILFCFGSLGNSTRRLRGVQRSTQVFLMS